MTENKSLEDWVFTWASASGVPELCETWVKDLKAYGIGNLESLEIVAQYTSDWEKLVDKIGPPLSSYLRKWLADKYKSSNRNPLNSDLAVIQVDKLSGTKRLFKEWFPDQLDKFDFKLRVSDIVNIFSMELEFKNDGTAANEDDFDQETVFEFFVLRMNGFPPLAEVDSAHPAVLIRPCYYKIFENILEHITKHTNCTLAIIGNIGIGKSRFYLYCIYRMIQILEHRNSLHIDSVLIINKGDMFYIWEPVMGLFRKLTLAEVEHFQGIPFVIRLIESHSSHLDGWTGASVIFSSPGFEPMKKFLKVYPKKWIMPVWSLSELQVLNEYTKENSREELEKLYFELGGIPRAIYNSEFWKQERKSALESANSVKLTQIVQKDDPVQKDQFSHYILKLVPYKGDYSKYYLDFASNEVVQLVSDKMANDSAEDLTSFFVLNTSGHDLSVLRGRIFEKLAHRWFYIDTLQKKVLARPLGKDQLSLDFFLPNDIEKISFSSFDDLDFIFQDDSRSFYCIPAASNFACADSFLVVKMHDIKLFVVLQMTINLNHGIRAKHMSDLLKWIDPSYSVRFMFVVPNEDLVRQFTVQKFLTVKNTTHSQPHISLTEMQQYVTNIDVLNKSS
jgi:hypothetical protein